MDGSQDQDPAPNPVARLWRSREVPDRQAVYFPDGSALGLTVDPAADGGLRVGPPVDVQALLAEDPQFTTSADAVLARAETGSGRLVQAGECDFGSEGYFALLEPDGALVWVVLLENDNPFVAIEIGPGLARLRSSSDVEACVATDGPGFTPCRWPG